MTGLWPGAEVRLRSGAIARVVDPGQYTPGTMLLAFAGAGDERHEPPDGVLIELPSGERRDVPFEELELLWREHPCRAEPDGTLALWLLHELWKFDWYEAFERVFERTYPALAKLYHPWEREDSETTATWTEVARVARLRDRHALAELRGDDFNAVPGFSGPDEGSLDVASMRSLNEVLRPATTTPDDVLFAIWEGWGGASWERFPGRAQVPFTQRPCRLLRGPLDAAAVTMDVPWAHHTLRPLVWWPADRAWAAHCDVDWIFTCVGGTEELIDSIVAHPRLEAVRISADEVY